MAGSRMNFRTLIIIRRIVMPLTLVILVAGFVLLDDLLAKFAAGIPFAAAWCVIAPVIRKVDHHAVAAMRCPICGDEGAAGRGTWGVGWWLACEQCGTVHPRGILGLRFASEPAEVEPESHG